MYATCSSFYSPFYFLANNPERFHNPLQVWATMHPAGSMSIFGFEEVLEFSQIRDKRVRLWHHQVEETVEVKWHADFSSACFLWQLNGCVMQHTLPEPTEMCFMCSRRWCERGRLVWLFCFVLTPEDRSDFSSTCLSERQMEKMVGDDDLVKRKVSWAIIKCALLAYKKKGKKNNRKAPSGSQGFKCAAFVPLSQSHS